jgi:predicted XRE-type DNA-binding protein
MKKWPKQENIEAILKRLDENPDLYSRIVPNDAPVVDLIKRDMCAELIIYKREHNLNQRELSQKLEISEALVSKLLRYHFDEFTLDRLIRYLESLNIKFEFKRVA